MELAKDRLDVGVYTNSGDEMRDFYAGTVGLPYEELLKVGRGVHQHRYGLRGSVLKLNASRHTLDETPTAFRRLVIAGSASPRVLHDPDGLEVELVAPGTNGVEEIGLDWATRDIERLGRLLATGFGAVAMEHDRWRVGTTVLHLVHDPAAPDIGPMNARGLRYLTVQVRDVRREHEQLVAAGWVEGRQPVRLGDVAFISFVRDPEGSWIEVSQRASLTGPLPDA